MFTKLSGKTLLTLALFFLCCGLAVGQQRRGQASTSSSKQASKPANKSQDVTVQIATTTDGRTVILRSDGTWEYSNKDEAVKTPPPKPEPQPSIDAAMRQQAINDLKALPPQTRAAVSKAVLQMWRVSEVSRLTGGGNQQHYTEMLLADGYMDEAERVLPDGFYKKLLQTCHRELSDGYKLATYTASLDDLMRMDRAYGFGNLQPVLRPSKVMRIANADLRNVLDIAEGAGLMEREK